MLRDTHPQAHRSHPNLHKVVSLICTPDNHLSIYHLQTTGMTVSQVADEVLYTGLIEMQELDDPGLGKHRQAASPRS